MAVFLTIVGLKKRTEKSVQLLECVLKGFFFPTVFESYWHNNEQLVK